MHGGYLVNGHGQGQDSGWQPADRGRRIVAATVDGVIAFFVSVVPLIGGLVAAAYMLVRDGLDVPFLPHQSLGKKLLGIQAVGRDGRPLDLGQSVARNMTLGVAFVASFFTILPVIGNTVAVVMGLFGGVLGIIELVLILVDPQNRRLGDKMADTHVILKDRTGGTP